MPAPRLQTGVSQFQDYHQRNRELFERLATEGQSPDVLFIGCSDSRVPPEVITQSGAGDLFVSRSLGNIVPPFGTGQMGIGAVIEFALHQLHVKQIIICGHTDCGGIHALFAAPDWSRDPHIARWIEHARPAKTKVEASGLPPVTHHRATVRENVLLQLENLRSYDPVRSGERAGTLTLHGWVYDLDTGEIEGHSPQTGTWASVAP